MFNLAGIDVEEIATALADQTDYEHLWMIDPRTGQVAFWTSDTGIDGEKPVEIEELDQQRGLARVRAAARGQRHVHMAEAHAVCGG